MIENVKTQNKLRTPPRSPKNCDKLINTKLTDKEDDRSRVQLAEIYTLNKRLEKLNSELDEKQKLEAILNKRIEDLEMSSNEQINKLLVEINDQKIILEDVLNKNAILEKTHNYNEIIEYYENKFEENKNKNVSFIQMFTQMLNKIIADTGVYKNNKDDVWRNAIKKYENKITEMELQLAEFQKKERKIYCRQKFFEKYCSKAEEKIGQFSKISKKFYDQENKIQEMRNEIEKYQNVQKSKSEETTVIHKELETLKNENQKMKNFVNKIKPILKIDWEDIKKNNEETFENLVKLSNNEEFNYNSKNIIILIENLKDFVVAIEDSIQVKVDFSQITNIIDDVKNYTIMLLKKVQSMTINQYHIINCCCELNDKIMSFVKNNKVNLDFLSVLKDIRNTCSKLLFEYNPK